MTEYSQEQVRQQERARAEENELRAQQDLPPLLASRAPVLRGGEVFVGGEVVDVAAAFEPYGGKAWAVVGTTNHPVEWPAFLDEALRLDWEFRYAHQAGGWTYLYFRSLPPFLVSTRD